MDTLIKSFASVSCEISYVTIDGVDAFVKTAPLILLENIMPHRQKH